MFKKDDGETKILISLVDTLIAAHNVNISTLVNEGDKEALEIYTNMSVTDFLDSLSNRLKEL